MTLCLKGKINGRLYWKGTRGKTALREEYIKRGGKNAFKEKGWALKIVLRKGEDKSEMKKSLLEYYFGQNL